MTKRAKVRRVGELLRQQHLGRLYRGSKNVARRRLKSWVLDRLLHRLQFKVGDLVNDCDGFNHRIVRWLVEYDVYGVVSIDQFEREDGLWSCGCPTSPDPPLSQEAIEAYFRDITPEDLEVAKKGGWWTPMDELRYRALLNGEHICDENGMVLPKYEKPIKHKQSGEVSS